MSFAGPVSGDVRNALGLPLWLTGPWKRPARDGRVGRMDGWVRAGFEDVARVFRRQLRRRRAVPRLRCITAVSWPSTCGRVACRGPAVAA
jgi:hypothetical protein